MCVQSLADKGLSIHVSWGETNLLDVKKKSKRSLLILSLLHIRCIFISYSDSTLACETVDSSFPVFNKTCTVCINLTLEGPCIIFCNIYTFQRDTQCSSTDCLLMLRCQLYMCNVWGRPVLPQTLHQQDVPDSAFLTTYHSLHIQYLKRSSWGWTVTVRNM